LLGGKSTPAIRAILPPDPNPGAGGASHSRKSREPRLAGEQFCTSCKSS
jgi:hypothetical protein